jgi:hypothetical protein
MTSLARLPGPLLMIGGSLILLLGCVAGGGGYYGGTPGYGLDYYGAYGFDYGVWGPGYEVAPFYREREHEHDRGWVEHGGQQAPHAFRAAPASRPIPSIPSAPRGGGYGGGGIGHR